MKKWLSLTLVLVMTALLLAGCGGVKGAYAPVDGRAASELSSIRFDGKTAVFTLWGYSLSGSYTINGETLELTYDLLGKTNTKTILFSQKGDSIFLDGVEFARQSGGGKALVTALIVLVLLAVLAAAYFLLLRPHLAQKADGAEKAEESPKPEKKAKKRLGLFEKKKRDEELFDDEDEDDYDDFDDEDDADDAPVKQAVPPEAPEEDEPEEEEPLGEEEPPEEDEAPEEEDSAEDGEAEAEEDEGVRVWKPEAEEPQEETIPIVPDRCCVCGNSLDNGFAVLARLPSGEEARIDRTCHKALYILSNTTERRDFDRAAGYLEVRLNKADPLVANSLKRFIAKEEARLESAENA